MTTAITPVEGLMLTKEDHYRLALEAIGSMRITGDTKPAELAALCIAIAKSTLQFEIRRLSGPEEMARDRHEELSERMYVPYPAEY